MEERSKMLCKVCTEWRDKKTATRGVCLSCQTQITRYDNPNDEGDMNPMADGEWVKWEDVKSFIKPNAGLEPARKEG